MSAPSPALGHLRTYIRNVWYGSRDGQEAYGVGDHSLYMVLRGGKGGLDSLHATDDSFNSGTTSAVI